MKTIKVVVEIPNKSQIKYEYDRFDKKIKVDRILRGKFRYPANYGFIPNTLDYDGDELDVLIYSNQTFFPGVEINVRIVGLMEMIDSGETDNKLIAVHADDYQLDKIQNLSDLPSKWLKNIKYFFNNYKNWKGKNITQVKDFKDIKVAEKELNDTITLFKKYGKLPKKTFILKMKKLFPKKYT